MRPVSPDGGACWCRIPIWAPGLGAVSRPTVPPEEAERVGRDRRGAGGVTSRDGERRSARPWLGWALQRLFGAP